jgi:ubiquinone/menaquinone biosynthesis C-methylase UbiE
MEMDLLRNYPKATRNVHERSASKTDEDRTIARKFGKEFFDGERRTGYGGYAYHPRFWENVIPDFQKHYGLKEGDCILDVGCGKGFMLYDFHRIIPGIKMAGIDISSYAIENALDAMKPYLSVGDARTLPFANRHFDLVISINTIHNLEEGELEKSLKEIQRVSKGRSFITVDAYRNDEEKELMFAWNLTAKTILHVEEWKKLFQKVGYTGDYYWFMP